MEEGLTKESPVREVGDGQSGQLHWDRNGQEELLDRQEQTEELTGKGTDTEDLGETKSTN
jgi:hypothetical protein